MEFKVVAGPPEEIAVGGLIVFHREGDGGLTGLALEADQALEGHLSQSLASGEFKGKFGEVLTSPTFDRLPASRVIMVGLGKSEEFVLDRVRGALGVAGKALRRARLASGAVFLEDRVWGDLSAPSVAQAAVEGSVLGLYEFQKYKTRDVEDAGPGEIQLVISAGEPAEIEAANLDEIRQAVSAGRCLAEATNLARDMVNEPANEMTPTRMCEIATEVAQEWGLECTCLDRDEMESMGMGSLLGVAQGSNQPPRFIILDYHGGVEARGKPHPAFLGKGVTFDSGGISIKPSEHMEQMKGDMAGGAAVIGAMRALGELKPPINVTGIIPAVENMPSGHATRPGDVLKAMNGKTIEVISTDAEGRLILADALAYARREGFSPLVDVATLTGACAIALGPFYTGAFSNNRPFMDHLLRIAEEAGERFWPMPTDDTFKNLIKSDVADVKNVGGKEGGAITAALFLQEFAQETPWVHLDIAATAQSEEDRPYEPKGATGVTVRSLVGLALSLAEGHPISE
ncbi:MAG: leucyl aminopeptidase [Dehalococcoidia bacterium]|nr:leucyl aminopeptidase [Dehalococcoidia bacterium]